MREISRSPVEGVSHFLIVAPWQQKFLPMLELVFAVEKKKHIQKLTIIA